MLMGWGSFPLLLVEVRCWVYRRGWGAGRTTATRDEFLGTLVGMGVEGDGLVGQVTGLFVGFNVGSCVGISVPGPAGIVCIGWVGKGDLTGWIGLVFDEVVGSEPAGTWKCGVTVGTGVSMW